jgi:predicted Zn-dependent protease
MKLGKTKHAILITILMLIFSIEIKAQIKWMEDIADFTYITMKMGVGFYNDEDIQNKIEEIGDNIEMNLDTDEEIKFNVLDMQDLSAFATLGGYVYISRGLLSILDTEDELAGIIAHELVHINDRDATEKIYRKALPELLKVPGNLLKKTHLKFVGKLLNVPVDLTFGSINAIFDRMLEYKADRRGAELAHQAGYNPLGLEAALKKLASYQHTINGHEDRFEFLGEHPTTSKRTRKIRGIAKKYKDRTYESGVLYDMLDSLIIGPNPEKGVRLPDNTFAHPILKAQIEFPKTWHIYPTKEALSATNQSGKVGLLAGIGYFSTDMHVLADRYINEHQDDKKTVLIDDTININGYGARQVTLTKNRLFGKEFTQTTWIYLKNKDLVLVLTGTAKKQADFDTIHQIKSTFNTLDSLHASQIVTRYLHVDTSRVETVGDFIFRKEGQDNIFWIEGLNHKKLGDTLKNEIVKWVSSEPYKYEK